MMQPRQAHLGDGPRTTADYQARVPGKGHQEISRISHAAGNQDAARPIPKVDVVGRDDAYDQSVCVHSSLCCHAGSRAAAPTHEGDPKPCEQFPGRTR
jgi:hypothetical protein